MKRKILNWILLLACIGMICLNLVLTSGCSEKKEPISINASVDIWVSPDGVEYWICKIPGEEVIYALAPRYNYDGTLRKVVNP